MHGERELAYALERREGRHGVECRMHGTGDQVVDGDHGKVGVPVHHGTHCGVEGRARQECHLAFDEARGCGLAEGAGLSLECDDGTHAAKVAGTHARAQAQAHDNFRA